MVYIQRIKIAKTNFTTKYLVLISQGQVTADILFAT